MARSKASARVSRGSRPSVVVLRAFAGTPDHDAVGLDDDLDLALAGPVLGVHRIVRDGRVEPQPVALLAVVERALERPRRPGRAPAAPTAAAAAALGTVLVLVLVLVLVALVLGGLLVLLGAAGGLGLELGGDQRVVLRAQIDLVVEVDPHRGAVAVALGGELVLALERLDLLDRHLELVRDPRVRPALANPGADLVEVGAERSSGHQKGRILVETH